METPLLRDPNIFPSKEVLEQGLGNSYQAFHELIKSITDDKLGLNIEWRYYRDGKAWLCKATYKKKTVFWLSVWDKYFKTTFYFMERHRAGIEALDIEKQIKVDFRSRKFSGKLMPLTISVRMQDQINDILKIVAYKRNLK